MRSVIALALVTLAAPLSAQGSGAAAHSGTLTVIDRIATDPGLTPAQRAKASAIANKVVAILRRDPAIANPVGYSVTLRVTARRRRSGEAPAPETQEIIFGSAKYFVDRDGQIEQGAAGFDFHVAVNGAGFASEIAADDPAADRGPPVLGADPANLAVYRRTGTWRGRPIYAGDCTYLTHRPAPPIVPVTTERYLSLRATQTRAAAARHEAQSAGASATPSSDALQAFLRDRPQRDAANKKTLDILKQSGASDEQVRRAAEAFRTAEAREEAALREEASDGSDQAMQNVMDRARAANAAQAAGAQASVDALSANERQAPARVVEEGADDFRLARSDDADDVIEPLMQANPAFYDRALPADEAQLIWVCAYHLEGLPDDSYDRLAEGTASWRQEKAWNARRIRDVARLREQLDWAALEALLKP